MSNKTYDDLVQNLQDWLEDDDAEFVGSIPEVINLGEMRVWRDLDLSIFTSEDTAATAIGSPTLTKPVTDTELVAWTSMYYTVNNVKRFPELRSVDFVRDHQVIGSNAAPRYYAELSETQIEFSPIPDAVYTINFRGITRPTQLATGNQTTWLSLHQDDLLFKACLAEAEAFLKSDDRQPMWTDAYMNMLPLAKRETYTMLKDHYQLTPLEAPGVPTIGR